MKTLNEGQKELENIYSKVVEKFPRIKKEEIKAEFNPTLLYAKLSLKIEKFLELNKIVIKPKIIVGEYFFKSSEKEKEAIIAHELGHYTHYTKNHSFDRLARMIKWEKTMKDYCNNWTKRIIVNLSKKKSNRIKKLQKWYILREIYADNCAVDVGYGEQMLKFVKRLFAKDYETLTLMDKKKAEARIKNLEEKLEDGFR